MRQKVSGRDLYAVRGENGERRLPGFQFSSGGVVPGIEEVMRVVPRGVHPVALHNFMTNPDLYLDEEEEAPVSPRDWLLSGGDPAAVVPLARELF